MNKAITMRRGRWMGALAAGLLCSAQALSCGACDEDKVAATYDHAVLQAAAAQKKLVVFCDVQGRVQPQQLRQVAARVPGVDAGSIRTSAAPAALSFALDPKQRLPETAVAEMGKALGPETRLLILKSLAGAP